MVVSPLQDTMNHYLWNFNAYLLALAIILLNAARSVYFYLRNKHRPLYPKRGRLDPLISLLCGVSLAMGLMFRGILADNSVPDIYHQSNYLWMVCFVSLALFIVQIIFYVKTPSVHPRVEPTDEVPTLQTASQEQFQPQTPLRQSVVSREDSVPKDGEQ